MKINKNTANAYAYYEKYDKKYNVQELHAFVSNEIASKVSL